MTDVTVWARSITERIRKAGEDLGALIVEAHDGCVWESLGYASWSDYVAGEFDFSRRRSYQLLEQGRINKRLADAGSTVRVTEREARDVNRGTQPAEIEQQVIERRAVPKPSRKHKGFQAPTDRVRDYVDQFQAWYESMDPDYPIDPQFARQLTRLRDVIDSMLDVAAAAERRPIEVDFSA